MGSMLRAVVSALKRVRVARAAALVVAMLALAVALVTTPGCGRQTDRIPRIGFVSSVPSSISDGFREGLKELGLAEAGNIIVEWRWTEGKPERSAELAAELVQLKPDLIVTTSGHPTAAVKVATDTIPIVFIAVGDPVRSGIVPSLARPGGNITGFANLVTEGFSGKMLEKLLAAVPWAVKVAVLMNPTSADRRLVMSTDLPPDAERLGVTLIPLEVTAAGELGAAFERAGIEGLLQLVREKSVHRGVGHTRRRRLHREHPGDDGREAVGLRGIDDALGGDAAVAGRRMR